MFILMELWGNTQRPWGYEIRADFRDSDTGIIYHEEMCFPAIPSQQQIDDKVEEIIRRLVRGKELENPPARYQIVNQDGTTTYI